MAQNKIERFGPVALTTIMTTNIIHPAAAGASGVGYTATASRILLRKLNIVNKTSSAHTFSLWLGATGGNVAGTEVVGTAQTVPANSSYPWQGQMRIGSTDYLVGGCPDATSLTLEGEGEVGLE